MQLLDRTVIGLNNLVVKSRGSKGPPDEIVVLLPSCLQGNTCPHNVTENLANCQRCNRCKVGPLLNLAEKTGIRMAMAKGSRVAVQLVKEPHVKAVIAVACERELRNGVLACFPKPILGLLIRQPYGPCYATDIDVDTVERAIEWFRGST